MYIPDTHIVSPLHLFKHTFAASSVLSGKHSHHAIRLLITLNYSDFLTVFPTQSWGWDSEKLSVRRTQGTFVLQITGP